MLQGTKETGNGVVAEGDASFTNVAEAPGSKGCDSEAMESAEAEPAEAERMGAKCVKAGTAGRAESPPAEAAAGRAEKLCGGCWESRNTARQAARQI